MPLPTDKDTVWPPVSEKQTLADIRQWAAWYSGDTAELSKAAVPADQPKTAPERLRFWARQQDPSQPKARRYHVPLAEDIASVSAGLLFAEPPSFPIPEAHETSEGEDDGEEGGQPDPRRAATQVNPQAAAAQDELDRLTQKAGLANTLLEGAEIAAGLGGVYLRVAWDQDVTDHPFIAVTHPDAAVPDFRWGRLVGVTFHRVVQTSGQQVWRHLERHEPGVILHGLYVGAGGKLGRQVPLDTLPATAGLLDEVRLPPALAKQHLVRYVPNVRPNRKRRHSPHGRADIQGTEDFLDALDETYTSWMRDIRLGKMRIIVSNEMLDRRGRGQGATFNDDTEVFSPLEFDPSQRDKAIEPVEFVIRTEQHAATALNLVERIVSSAGYSPQSFGLHIEGRAESGTALRVREGKTLNTQGRKQRYWQPEIEDELELLQVVNREVFGRRVEVFRPSVAWADSLANDPLETAQSVDLLGRALAASIETRVRMAQPGLDDAQVVVEVARIKAENGMAVPDPMQAGALA